MGVPISLAFGTRGDLLSSPGNFLYIASSQDFLVNNAIETVSISYTRGGNQNGLEFLIMDDFAYRFPFTNFINPAGNGSFANEVHWQAYNALTVGMVRHTEEVHYELDVDIPHLGVVGVPHFARNPAPVYGSCLNGNPSGPCAGDREMPHVVAPGITPSVNDDHMVDNVCLGAQYPAHSGTSLSVPVLNGIAADVISADPRMRYWSIKVRVAIILTAHNVDEGNWDITDSASGLAPRPLFPMTN